MNLVEASGYTDSRASNQNKTLPIKVDTNDPVTSDYYHEWIKTY